MTGRLILASRIGAALLTATPPDSAEPTDQITRELFAGGLDRADRSHAGQQPSRRCGAQVGRRAARDQVSEQGMKLVTSRVRWATGLSRRSSSNASTVARSRRGPGWPHLAWPRRMPPPLRR
jgi:hypothetical protein